MPSRPSVMNGNRRAWKSAFFLALVSTGVFLLSYRLGVHSAGGQRTENALLSASDFEYVVPAPLGLVSVPLVLLAAVCIALIALVSEGFITTLIRMAGLGLPILASQALKYQFLERPDLLGLNELNSFPSGHATVVAALAFTLILVTPAGLRWISTVLGGTLLAVVSWQLLAYGWHRPSDVLAGVALAAGGVALGVLARPGFARNAPRIFPRVVTGLGLLLGLGAAVVLAWVFLVGTAQNGLLLLAGQLGCVAFTIVCAGWVTALPNRSRR